MAMDLSVELCKRCVRELDTRLAEVAKAATPIEQLASNQEVIMGNGCTYIVNKAFTKPCGIICDAGQTLCPRHILLRQLEVQKAHQKDQEKHARKVAALKGKVAA